MSLHPRVTGVILAGGRARRMGGRDKTGISLGAPGDTPLSRILRVFSGRFPRCVLVTHPGAEAVPTEGVTIAHDLFPGCGPLGGLHAGLRSVATPLAFVCGGDMPALSGPLIDHLVARARDDRPLVPVRSGRPEPLHAVYPATCLAAAEKALREGIRMMLDFFATLEVDYLPEEEYAGIAGALASFENLNTPEDLARVIGREPVR
jgi:molybdopterin-guanine dinucleotide biosynthesis protein A